MEQLVKYPECIAVIGNHLPRHCGIATFTTDLCNAMAAEMPDSEGVIALAMDDREEGYDYPDRVRFEVRDQIPTDYLRAAEYLNVQNADVVILQHEYGIFGGPAGSHILQLLENIRTPIITTLHTVLRRPDQEQRTVIMELTRLSDMLVVMSRTAMEILAYTYKIPREKIIHIPHGIPDVPFLDPCFYKDQFGVENRKVILSFGLLSPGKGLETMIEAMPGVIEQHPDALYMILGATHPHVYKAMGEKYRHELQQRIRRLGIEDNVLFHNRFVELKTLIQFICASDVYVTPYPNREQIVSGTLSYALGAGKAVVSTPYHYAEEMLDDGRGIIVPFEDPKALCEAVAHLLSNDAKRNAMRKRAYQYCRRMIWKEVARSYLSLARKTAERFGHRPRSIHRETRFQKVDMLPKIKLDHLQSLTDDTGILQHARYSIPLREYGYCTDDNARALIVAAMYYNLRKDACILTLLKTYLSFLMDAFDPETGRFRNFMSYDRRWRDGYGSEDSHGRALWALGTCIPLIDDEAIRAACCRQFIEGLNACEYFQSPRGWAFTLIGLNKYLEVYTGDACGRKVRADLAGKLLALYETNATEEWPWFEDTVTYANGMLPRAMLSTGRALDEGKLIDTGLTSLEWILTRQTGDDGQLSLIGNDGWMTRGKTRARFDQQPLELIGLIGACADALMITRDDHWLSEARRCFDWFMGRNDLNSPVYDFRTGGCFDGLQPQGVNQNLGAESTLAWLISLLTMYEVFGEEALLPQEQVTTATEEVLDAIDIG
ncbi:MAG: glycosyltransferase [Candidatus Glassbacteria bacterium]